MLNQLRFRLTCVVIILFSTLSFSHAFPGVPSKKTVNGTNDILNFKLISQILEGPCEAVAVHEYIAFIGNGNYFEILDIANPAEPHRLGRLALPHFISGILYHDGLAYVSAGYGGLRIIDVSDLSNPIEIGHIKNNSWFHSLVIQGNYAFCANGFNGLLVLDISDPTAPVIAAHLGSVGLAFNIKLNNNFAYIPGRYYGFYLVNVTNPTAPELITHIDPGYYFEKLYLQDNYAFVSALGSGVIVYDISQTDTLTEVCTIPTYSAYDVVVAGNFLYVAGEDDGLSIFDISTLTSAVEIGSYDTNGKSKDIVKMGEIVYLGDYQNGLRVIDVTTKNAPTEIGSYDTRGETSGIVADGNYMYVVERDKGFRTFDISDINNPIEIGFCDLVDPIDLKIRDQYAFVADDYNGVRVVDISNPSDPVEVAGANIGSTYGIKIQDDYAYVGTMYGGLTIVNIQDPLNPVTVGNYENDGYSFTVDVVEIYAYVANGNQGLRIYNVSDPENPVEIFQHKPDGCYFRDVKINGSYAYIADMNNDAFRILDISDPTVPVEAAVFKGVDTPFSILINENFAYVAEHESGIILLDLSNPVSPTIAAEFDQMNRAQRMALVNELLFVTNYTSGAVILDYQEVNPFAPNAPGNLQAVQLIDQIHLTWDDNSNDETGFYIEMNFRNRGWSIVDTVGANILSAQIDISQIRVNYKFRVAAYNQYGRSTYSNCETIDTIELTEWIKIRTPNGGEEWEYGTEQELRWSASSTDSITTITAEYSIDGGSTWISPPLATEIPNTNYVTFSIPYAISDNCILKISDADDGIPYDLSDEPFSIIEGEPNLPAYWTFTDRTGNSATAIIPEAIIPNIDGNPLQLGYYVGVFTENDLCCGFKKWTNENLALTVWGDNDITPEIDGFQTGQMLYYRVFNSIDSLEYTNVNVAYSQGDGLYAANAVLILSQFEIRATGTEKSATDEIIPTAFKLCPNYPNPFNPQTTISFQLPVAAMVELIIYNIQGKTIRTLINSEQNAGFHSIVWNGQDEAGHAMPSGVYLVSIRGGKFSKNRKCLLMK